MDNFICAVMIAIGVVRFNCSFVYFWLFYFIIIHQYIYTIFRICFTFLGFLYQDCSLFDIIIVYWYK